MPIGVLLLAAIGTVFVVYLIQQGHIPAPFVWIVYLILIVAWLVLTLNAMGFGGMHLGRVG